MNSGATPVLDVTDQTFEKDVLERSKSVPVVVDFWAPWCGPCRAIGPVLEKLASEAGGSWVLAKVNTDENPALSQALQISSIPLVIAFKDGQVADEFVGALPEAQIKEFVKRVAPPVVMAPDGTAVTGPPAVAPATAAGPSAAAAPPISPEEEARLAAIRGRLAGSGNVAALEAAVAANPTDLSARLDLGKSLAGAGRHGEAFEQFLEIVRRNRAFQDDAGRKAMLDLFELLGHEHPMTERFRRELAGVLFA